MAFYRGAETVKILLAHLAAVHDHYAMGHAHETAVYGELASCGGYARFK